MSLSGVSSLSQGYASESSSEDSEFTTPTKESFLSTLLPEKLTSYFNESTDSEHCETTLIDLNPDTSDWQVQISRSNKKKLKKKRNDDIQKDLLAESLNLDNFNRTMLNTDITIYQTSTSDTLQPTNALEGKLPQKVH